MTSPELVPRDVGIKEFRLFLLPRESGTKADVIVVMKKALDLHGSGNSSS